MFNMIARIAEAASETAADVATDSAVDTATSAAAETAASVAGGFFGAAKEAVITWVGNNPVTAGVVGGVAATGAIYGTWKLIKKVRSK